MFRTLVESGPTQLWLLNMSDYQNNTWFSITLQFINKIIFLMSFLGNRGTFSRGCRTMITDVEFLYHLLYLIIGTLGVFVHVFFYSLLVCVKPSYNIISSSNVVPFNILTSNNNNIIKDDDMLIQSCKLYWYFYNKKNIFQYLFSQLSSINILDRSIEHY